MDNGEKFVCVCLFIFFGFIIINSISTSSEMDNECNLTILDKKIEYIDGIEVHTVKYRIDNGTVGSVRSTSVYYSCEVGKRYHVVIQSDGVWKSWSEID